jgi:hypothetical protein
MAYQRTKSATLLPVNTDSAKPVTRQEETDLWWGAYAGRAMIPSLAFCVLLTALILGSALYVGGWHDSDWMRFTVQTAIILIWIVQSVRWIYRTIAINYRLTSERLFKDVGLRRPDNQEVRLDQIVEVVVSQTPLERRLGIGQLAVVVQGNSNPSLVLEGIHKPEAVAALLREQVKASKQRGGTL